MRRRGRNLSLALRELFVGVGNGVAGEGFSCGLAGSLWSRIYVEDEAKFSSYVAKKLCAVVKGSHVLLVQGHESQV